MTSISIKQIAEHTLYVTGRVMCVDQENPVPVNPVPVYYYYMPSEAVLFIPPQSNQKQLFLFP